jgi:poly-gamma-glutamate synthesis protein (capsule biosynthesis protein)
MKNLAVVLFVVLGLFCPTIGKSAQKQTITLSFVGDILLAGVAGQRMLEYGTSYPLSQVAPILKRADITCGNLECALTGKEITRNVRVGQKQLFVFKTLPRFSQALVDGGINIVSVANNHSLNGGRSGLLDTMNALDKVNVKFIGAGRNASEYRQPKIIEVKGRKVGYLAYTDIGGAEATKTQPGVATLKNNVDQCLREISALKNKVDIVVVVLHWGIEGTTSSSARQKTLARKFIDAGADVIIGAHPHRLQPVEKYHGKTIAYSLGNFVFDNPSVGSCKTGILEIKIEPNGSQIYKLIPCKIKVPRPTPSA